MLPKTLFDKSTLKSFAYQVEDGGKIETKT